MLHSAHQVLASHVPGLQHDGHVALVHHLEAAGVHVIGYIPDDTMILVGSPDALHAATNHSRA